MSSGSFRCFAMWNIEIDIQNYNPELKDDGNKIIENILITELYCMIIILFLLTKILWTFLCQRGVKEIIFRSLDVFPSHAHRNCNDFIFCSGTLWKYMAGSLWMYSYVCNNEFTLFKYKLFSLIKIMGQDHVYCWIYKYMCNVGHWKFFIF